jgi:hypothetical protein
MHPSGFGAVVKLDQVTLCCVDGKNHAMALRALDRSRQHIRFARVVLLTNALPERLPVPSGIEAISAGSLSSEVEYSHLVLKRLYDYVVTPYVLLVQWDGYVAHPEMWQDRFLEVDYLGAPWPDGQGGFSVGNGGFSLRSRKLLAALQDSSFSLLTTNEDVTICGFHRKRLESEFGIRFGTPDLARQFSFEMDTPYIIAGGKTFGFHGIFNLFLIETQQEIAAVASNLTDDVARLASIQLLLSNLLQFQMWEACLALGQRILAASPENDYVAGAVVQAREMLAQRADRPRRNQGIVRRLAERFRIR